MATAVKAGRLEVAETASFEELLRDWDGEEVVIRYDRPSGAWMFICLHSTALGPAVGGTRMRVYPWPAEGLVDAMRLSAGMTKKNAVAGLPAGGGKAVLAVRDIPRGRERRGLLLRYGAMVESLRGSYMTGPDMNTVETDMDVIGEVTEHVGCRTEANGGSGSPVPGTSRGVLEGIRAAVTHAFGSPSLADRTVLVQGVGQVGETLARLLAGEGARVLVSDVDGERPAFLAGEIGAEIVWAADAIGTPCDVFAPCAIGGVINEESIRLLRCRVVAGAANNQLATPEDADRLRDAGILYVPDYVVNAGGVIYAFGQENFGWSRHEVMRRVVEIGGTVADVLRVAERDGISTLAAADRLAEARLRTAKASKL